MKFERLFTKEGEDVYEQVEYDIRSSTIRNPDGSVVYEMNNVEVPKSWSQVATDILAQKYFRKKGVPLKDSSKGSEHSVKQVVHRLANCWMKWGLRYDYFDSEEDAKVFYDEIAHMLLRQMAAPNSPQWFNTGLAESYDIRGTAQGHYSSH